jgi:Uma2 family endonuclease
MGMPAFEPVTTVDELLALPEDGLRHELLAGNHVVTPAPRPNHERVVSRLSFHIMIAVGGRTDLDVFTRSDIHLRADTLVEPDLVILRTDPAAPFEQWAEAPVPLLAVEVLSPSTAARDRGVKRRLYLEAGVEEYWIVDVDARMVERWRSGDVRPEIVDKELGWELSVGVGGTIDLAVMFVRIQ